MTSEICRSRQFRSLDQSSLLVGGVSHARQTVQGSEKIHG
ncbi:hypothetical protein HMPREF1979_03187 [Actinomyces johnsonii F0542]|uniref:Uncharacterized protein n=1 Tax=Actinomyces johnsonii F0542 TaxID=1321818 RepID=U1QFZ7_9ACTO|nr:hypothetical protein HMPREF1979_03187 [Actinomyces johnsonii F0542]